MTSTAPAATTPCFRLGRRRLRFFDRRLAGPALAVSLGIPTTPGERKSSHRDLSAHGTYPIADRAIMALRGRNPLQLFFGLPTGFASVFIQRHGILVIKGAFSPNLKLYRGPPMPALDRFFNDPESFWRTFPDRPGTLCFTNGCFDLLHPGHVQYLEDVRALGDFLVLGLNSDASVRRLKGPGRPLQDEWARARILLGLRSIDAVITFDEDTPLELISALQPDILAKGGDYTPETVVGKDIVEARGGKLVLVPFLPGHSTTLIEDRIRSGQGICLT